MSKDGFSGPAGRQAGRNDDTNMYTPESLKKLNNNEDINNNLYNRLVRLSLATVLLILPFLSNFPTIDEIATVIFLFLACVEFYKQKIIPRGFLILLAPLVVFGVFGFVSGIINGNSLLVTTLGTYDYVKNFLVIFIYATFFRDFNEFWKLFRLLLIVTVFIGTVALIQFLWAMGSVYIFNKDILDPTVYVLFNSSLPAPDTLQAVFWRYGIFRTPLTSTALGLYYLLILTVYLYCVNKLNIVFFIPIIAGNISSASRMVYAGLVYILSIQVLIKKKWMLAIPLLLVIAFVLLAYVNLNGNVELQNISHLSKPVLNLNSEDIRLYSAVKSIEIWKDHPYLGVGPGMFGGIISFKYNSHINDLYDLRKGYIEKVGSIEQFWPQILVETGIVGTLCFIGFIVVLYITLNKLREQAMSQELKNYFSAMLVFIPCILIVTLGSGINVPAVFFTYCAFVGIGWGCSKNEVEH